MAMWPLKWWVLAWNGPNQVATCLMGAGTAQKHTGMPAVAIALGSHV